MSLENLQQRVRKLEIFVDLFRQTAFELISASDNTKRMSGTFSLSGSTTSIEVRQPDPPQQSIPLTPVIESVLQLVEELSKPGKNVFISKIVKTGSALKELFQKRDEKAKMKYNHGLSMEDKIEPLSKASEKLADVIFFLTKLKESRKTKNLGLTDAQLKELDQLRDMQKLLNSLLQDIK